MAIIEDFCSNCVSNIDAKCLIYSGPYLSNIDVAPMEHLNGGILRKINNTFEAELKLENNGENTFFPNFIGKIGLDIGDNKLYVGISIDLWGLLGTIVTTSSTTTTSTTTSSTTTTTTTSTTTTSTSSTTTSTTTSSSTTTTTTSTSSTTTSSTTVAPDDCSLEGYAEWVEINPTPDPAPTEQAKDLIFSSVERGSFTLDLTRGNGEAVLIVARIGEPVTQFPIDGISYVGDTSYGKGNEVGLGNFVVYNGSDSSITVTDFDPGTEVYIRAFERNGTTYNISPEVDNPDSQQLLPYPLLIYKQIASDIDDWTFDGVENGSLFTGGVNHGDWGHPQIGLTNPPTLDTDKLALKLTRTSAESIKFHKPVDYADVHEVMMVLEIPAGGSEFWRIMHAANTSNNSSFLVLDSNEQLIVNATGGAGIEAATGVIFPEDTKLAFRVRLGKGANNSFVQINKGEKVYFTTDDRDGNDTVWFGSRHTTSSTFNGWIWAVGENQGIVSDEDWESIVDYYIS